MARSGHLLALAALLAGGPAGCAHRIPAAERDALLDRLFAPPTAAERQAVRDGWRKAEVPVEDVRVEWRRTERDGRRTLVLSHLVGGARHYGAVRIPPHAPGARLPVLVVLHGGSRGASGYHFFHRGPIADGWIQLLPSFRAERLWLTPLRVYRSGGRESLWDGDVEDAMALLGAALGELPDADPSRAAAFGHSRGGGVALLMGIRDPRLKAVVAVSAPTDFFLPEVRRVAERAFRLPLPRLPGAGYLADSVLFALRGRRTSLEHARLELLRRSAARFTEDLPPTQLHHGCRDDKVPFAHALAMEAQAARDGAAPVAALFLYPEGGHRTSSLNGVLPRAEAFLSRSVAEAAVAAPETHGAGDGRHGGAAPELRELGGRCPGPTDD